MKIGCAVCLLDSAKWGTAFYTRRDDGTHDHIDPTRINILRMKEAPAPDGVSPLYELTQARNGPREGTDGVQAVG